MHFECTSCGKCCHFPDGHRLVISALEWEAYADRFPLYCSLEFFRADLVAVGLREHYSLTKDESWQHIVDTGRLIALNGSQYLHMRAQIYALPGPDGNCLALKDKKCTIYAERPLVCQTYPVVTDFPKKLLDEASVAALMRDIEEKEYECKSDNSVPSILKSGNLPTHIESLIDKYWEGLRELSCALADGAELKSILKDVYLKLRTNASFEWRMDMTPIMRVLPPKRITDTNRLLQRQMQLLQSVMDASMANEARTIASQLYLAYQSKGIRP